mmetsp:Transcript_7296/g.9111  ORF Transcript_7296/g.9111 Transcript_7296/m.9111 type:complete len:224 (-) Transcript_7296:246-917(-)
MEKLALTTVRMKCILSVELILWVISPYKAANTPMIRVEARQKDPKYKEDFSQSCNWTAGSTPRTPPGPAIPCTTPTEKARSLCTRGLSRLIRPSSPLHHGHRTCMALCMVEGWSAEERSFSFLASSLSICCGASGSWLGTRLYPIPPESSDGAWKGGGRRREPRSLSFSSLTKLPFLSKAPGRTMLLLSVPPYWACDEFFFFNALYSDTKPRPIIKIPTMKPQ